MVTAEEIERRVEETDVPRTAKRSAAAKRVFDLAQRRATIAEQLSDIERELGEELAAAQDVIDIVELARFTDVPAADLARWLEARKPPRAKRKLSAAGPPRTDRQASRASSSIRTPATTTPTTTTPTTTQPASPAATSPAHATPRADTADVPACVTTG